jgi:hypothetical protein
MAGDVEWGALLQEIDDDPLVRVIRDYGPGAVLRALDDRGLEISGRYTDICNMCEDLFQRFSPAVLREAATSHLQTEMLTWLVRGGHDGGHATSVADPIETAKTDS